jgi:hypothetical protein
MDRVANTAVMNRRAFLATNGRHNQLHTSCLVMHGEIFLTRGWRRSKQE